MRRLLMASTILMCGITASFAQGQSPPESQQQMKQSDEGQRPSSERGDRDRDRDRGYRERENEGRRYYGDRDRDRDDRDRRDWDRREHSRDRDRDYDPRRRQRICTEDDDGDIHCRYR
jgi:hypothetical protein